MEEIHPEHVWSGNTTTHAYDESMIADDTSINILYPNHECFAILNIFLFKQAAVRAMDTIQNFVKAKLGNQNDKFFIAGASKASGLYIQRRRIQPLRAHILLQSIKWKWWRFWF